MSDRKNKPKKFKKRGQESSSSSSSSSESTSSLSSEDENNGGDIKPMKEYLGDRKELASQLFLAVKGDKLKMMLPQVLKKMELKELEEWCANELSGMSKARIISILNGQPLLQSSDSNDSDDSGPSLEIISDTEEWGDISDVEIASRDEESASKRASGSKKEKGKSKLRGVEPEKTRNKSLRGKVKSEADPKQQKSSDSVKVKKETEGNEQGKEKDGESLLDLLELEMRARAIRALIRKEEDIIPTNPLGGAQSSTSNPSPNPNSASLTSSKNRARDRQLSLKVVQDKLQELDSSFNRSVGENTREISEEEDVVLVLQPTTTIELLSSESDGEGGQGKRRNQKLENERVLEKGLASTAQKPEEERRKSDEGKERGAEIDTGDKISSSTSTPAKIPTAELEKGVEKSPKKIATDLEMFRMLKKKSQLKEIENNDKIGEKETVEAKETEEESSGTVSEEKKEDSPLPKSADLPEEEEKGPEESLPDVKPTLTKIDGGANKAEKRSELEPGEIDEEDKSTDLEIIIDLDDYPDDMEDLDTGEKEKSSKSTVNENPTEKRPEVAKEEAAKVTEEGEDQTAETWATRYYQTEDVQSVIKESKIQSEIRKRLRERQRLARLNNSPSLSAAQAVAPGENSTVEKNDKEKKEPSPTQTMGSVEEYLALKNSEADLIPGDLKLDKKPSDVEEEKIITEHENSQGEISSEKILSDTKNEKLDSGSKEILDKA